MRERKDAGIPENEVQCDRQNGVNRDQHREIDNVGPHSCYLAPTGRPKNPAGRKMMNRNSTTKVTASLHCGSRRHSARFSASPSNSPPQAAPRSDPMPPTMVAARLINITWAPTAGFNPSV